MRSENQSDIRKELAETRHEIKGEITELRGETTVVKGEVTELRAELAVVKGEVTELRTEMAVVKGDIAELRAEMAVVRGEITDMRGEITELRGKTATLSQDLSDFKLSVDQRFRDQGVLMEALRSNVEQIAEGMILLQDQIKANREERAAQFSQLESLVRLSCSGLDRRVSKLEERFST